MIYRTMCAWSSLIADASSKGHLPTNSWKKEMPVKAREISESTTFLTFQCHTHVVSTNKTVV